MAGEPDETVGSDILTNEITKPKSKKTLQDYWNIAYRGFVPGGLNAQGDSSAPLLPRGGDELPGGEAYPFSETPVTIVDPEEEPVPDAVGVVILDDLTRVAGRVETYLNCYQVSLGIVGTTAILQRDPRRTTVRLRYTDASNIVYIGESESIGVTGYPLVSGVEYLFTTTRQIWAAITATAGTPSLTAVNMNVLVEYQKEI